MIAAEIARPAKGHFNVIHADTGFKADFYTAGRDEFNAWAFRNSRKMEYRGEPIIIAPPEYVIVRKLEYFREGRSEKHLRDIRAMLAVSGEQLDRATLSEWIQRQGLESEWRLVLRESLRKIFPRLPAFVFSALRLKMIFMYSPTPDEFLKGWPRRANVIPVTRRLLRRH